MQPRPRWAGLHKLCGGLCTSKRNNTLAGELDYFSELDNSDYAVYLCNNLGSQSTKVAITLPKLFMSTESLPSFSS